MRLLFSAPHFAYFKNFESALIALAERGHSLCLAADEAETFGGYALVERLAAAYPRITFGSVPSSAGESWMPFAQKIRYALDYARFCAPRYADVPKLRIRNVERAPRVVRWLTGRVGDSIVGARLVAGAASLAGARLPSWLRVATNVAGYLLVLGYAVRLAVG